MRVCCGDGSIGSGQGLHGGGEGARRGDGSAGREMRVTPADGSIWQVGTRRGQRSSGGAAVPGVTETVLAVRTRAAAGSPHPGLGTERT